MAVTLSGKLGTTGHPTPKTLSGKLGTTGHPLAQTGHPFSKLGTRVGVTSANRVPSLGAQFFLRVPSGAQFSGKKGLYVRAGRGFRENQYNWAPAS